MTSFVTSKMQKTDMFKIILDHLRPGKSFPAKVLYLLRGDKSLEEINISRQRQNYSFICIIFA